MAHLEARFDDGFFKELGAAADVERLAPKLIDAALPILQKALRAVYGGFQIANKLKLVQAKAARSGGFIGTITFKGNTGHWYKKGKNKYPLSNAGLAVFMEFGTGPKGNFPPTPAGGYVSKAVTASENEVKTVMQETFEKEMEALKL